MWTLLCSALFAGVTACQEPQIAGAASRPLPPVKVLTYNIRYGAAKDGPNAWEIRRPLVRDFLLRSEAGVVGLQEALDFQLQYLLQSAPHYRTLGQHREGGAKGEFCGLLIDKNQYEVIRWGEYWLSETPTEVGSKSWDSALPRMAVWAHLKERLTGREFAVTTAHFDHRGKEARLHSAKLILQHRSKIQNLPWIVLGDFNAAESSPPLKVFKAAGLRDTFREIHPQAAEAGTFHGFGGATSGKKIDYVLVDAGWEVHDARIETWSQDNRFPSDHFPVSALLNMPEREAPKSPHPQQPPIR